MSPIKIIIIFLDVFYLNYPKEHVISICTVSRRTPCMEGTVNATQLFELITSIVRFVGCKNSAQDVHKVLKSEYGNNVVYPKTVTSDNNNLKTELD